MDGGVFGVDAQTGRGVVFGDVFGEGFVEGVSVCIVSTVRQGQKGLKTYIVSSCSESET